MNNKIYTDRISRSLLVGILAFGLFSFPAFLFAEDMKGAANIIEQFKVVIDSGKEEINPIMEKRRNLMRDMEQFDKVKKSLSTSQAAAQWTVLAERFLQLPKMDFRQIEANDLEDFKLLFKTGTIKSLFEVLPGPNTWPEIVVLCQEKIEGKNDNPPGLKSILMFMNLLTNDVDLVLSSIDSFKTIALDKNEYGEEQIKLWFSRIEEAVKKYDPSYKASDVVDAFTRVLSSYESFATEPAIVLAPDLLKYTDLQKATQLLKRALRTSTIYLEIPSGTETRNLGIEVALAEINTLKRPQWGLVHSVNATALFEALNNKFGQSQISAGQDYAKMVQSHSTGKPFEGENKLRKRAISYYVLGLLSENRIDEAIDYILSLQADLISASDFQRSLEVTERTNLLPTYTVFLGTILNKKPELPFWKHYVKYSLISHKDQALHSTIVDVLSRSDLAFPLKQEIKKHLITVLLAQDKIDEALTIFSEVGATEPVGQDRKTRREFAELQFKLGRDLNQLGEVLERTDLKVNGTSMAISAFQDLLDNEEPSSFGFQTYKLGKLISLLIDQKDFSTAERLIVESTQKYIENVQKGVQYSSEMIEYTLAESFSELLKLYGKAGRYSDVLTLLDILPWWNAEDLSELYDEEILLVTAKALHTVNEDQKAIDILKKYLLENSNDDEGYRLLVEIAGNDIMPWLEKLYRMDRFEERPLMWQAYLLYKNGKYDQAEKKIRMAMSVDPTDGEQKAGQRIHSYTLLADILEAKGDTENAAFFRDVVKSVRIAEEGDEFTQAGLKSRSIDYYQDAMALFADAYCIQWRLGERYYETGDLENAKKHYRIAFERMPEQFGQVASFCFGCEGAFDKIQSRSAAEEVFSHLLETTPDKPQVYFLYGLLRNSQKRIPEAFDFFKKAIEIDPDYLDAWKEISKLSESVYLSRAEKDQIVIKMLSLDPQQKHFHANVSDVIDWSGLWETLGRNQDFIIKPSATLYPLKESAKTIRAQSESEGKMNTPDYYYKQLNKDSFNQETLKPSELLSQHNMVLVLDYFISLE